MEVNYDNRIMVAGMNLQFDIRYEESHISLSFYITLNMTQDLYLSRMIGNPLSHFVGPLPFPLRLNKNGAS